MSLREQKLVLRPINFLGAAIVVGTVLSGVWLHTIGSANEDYAFNINFSRGVAVDTRDMAKINEIVTLAATNSSYEIVITGHTGTTGDPAANKELSTNRAKEIEQLLRDAGVTNPIVVVGAGGTEPLEKLNNESDRDFQARLSRATVSVESDL